MVVAELWLKQYQRRTSF